jgi:hypothetical protein
MDITRSIPPLTPRSRIKPGTLATVLGVLASMAVTIVLALVPTSASAAAKLRGCGYQAYTYVSATSNVGCRTAERVIRGDPCGFGRTCRVDGYMCRMSPISSYGYEIACVSGRREIVGLGDLPKP